MWDIRVKIFRTPHRLVSPRVGLAALASIVLLVPSALAGPLDSVLSDSSLREDPQFLDDRALSEIRGRGTEGLDPEAAAGSDLAVILWDEQAGNPNLNQRGQTFSHSVGQGNVQATNLVTQRY